MMTDWPRPSAKKRVVPFEQNTTADIRCCKRDAEIQYALGGEIGCRRLVGIILLYTAIRKIPEFVRRQNSKVGSEPTAALP